MRCLKYSQFLGTLLRSLLSIYLVRSRRFLLIYVWQNVLERKDKLQEFFINF